MRRAPNFTCIENIGDEFHYFLSKRGGGGGGPGGGGPGPGGGGPGRRGNDGFNYSEGVTRCVENDSNLTSIRSEEEYNLILNFSNEFGLEKGFIDPSGEGDDILTWVGLTLLSDGIVGFEDDSNTSFFENFQDFPWDTQNNQPNFFDGGIHAAVFPINKLNSNTLFRVDKLGITYGIICRRPSDTCGDNGGDNETDTGGNETDTGGGGNETDTGSGGNETDTGGGGNETDTGSENESKPDDPFGFAGGLLSIEAYVAGMICFSVLLFVSVFMMAKLQKKDKKIINGSRYVSSNFVEDLL